MNINSINISLKQCLYIRTWILQWGSVLWRCAKQGNRKTSQAHDNSLTMLKYEWIGMYHVCNSVITMCNIYQSSFMRWLVDNPSLCVRRVLDTMLCSSTVPKYRTCSHMHNHADQSTDCDVAIKISSQGNWNYSSMKLKRFRCDLLFALPFFA